MSFRSGTAHYHGNLYEINQNRSLNANYFQANLSGSPVPAVHYNEFGGTFGGPVWVPKVYNGKNRDQEPIQMPLNFTLDVEELQLPFQGKKAA